jgi:uncharacterized protein HemX
VRTAVAIFGAIVLIAGASVGGYLLGKQQAPTATEAADARAEAEEEARAAAEERVFVRSHERGAEEGETEGREKGEAAGKLAGADAASKKVETQLAAIAAEEAAAAAAAEPEPNPFAGLEYTDQLPHGEPGYVLPEDERSLGCVGFDAETGECIGD